MNRFYEPDLAVDVDSPFVRDAANKLVRRTYTGRLEVVRSALGNVRFGSLADIEASPRHVRFTPNSGHWNSVVECPLYPKSGHGSVGL